MARLRIARSLRNQRPQMSGCTIEMPEGEVLGRGHVADASVLQRHFREDVKIVLVDFLARRADTSCR